MESLLYIRICWMHNHWVNKKSLNPLNCQICGWLTEMSPVDGYSVAQIQIRAGPCIGFLCALRCPVRIVRESHTTPSPQTHLYTVTDTDLFATVCKSNLITFYNLLLSWLLIKIGVSLQKVKWFYVILGDFKWYWLTMNWVLISCVIMIVNDINTCISPATNLFYISIQFLRNKHISVQLSNIDWI